MGSCVVVAIALIWYLGLALFHWIDHQDQNVRTAVIGAAALLAVPVVTYGTTRGIEQKRALEQSVRIQKMELYEGIFTMLMRVFEADIPGKPKPSGDDISRFVSDTKPELLTWASNEVCERWGVFWSRDFTKENEWDNAIALEGLLKVIRKDIGYSPIGLGDGDLSRIFINDVEKYKPADWNKKKPPYFVQWILSKLD